MQSQLMMETLFWYGLIGGFALGLIAMAIVSSACDKVRESRRRSSIDSHAYRGARWSRGSATPKTPIDVRPTAVPKPGIGKGWGE